MTTLPNAKFERSMRDISESPFDRKLRQLMELFMGGVPDPKEVDDVFGQYGGDDLTGLPLIEESALGRFGDQGGSYVTGKDQLEGLVGKIRLGSMGQQDPITVRSSSISDDAFDKYKGALDTAMANASLSKIKYRDAEGKLEDKSGAKGNAIYGARNAEQVNADEYFKRGWGFPQIAGAALGNVGAGIVGGLVNPTADEAALEAEEIARTMAEVDRAQKDVDFDTSNREAQARIDNYDSLEKDRVANRGNQKAKIEADAEAKKHADRSRQMATIASVYNKAGAFKADSPLGKKFEELSGAPLPNKVGDNKLTQDQKTGVWWVTNVTDGLTTWVEPLTTKDGQPFVTTPRADIDREAEQFKHNLSIEKLKLTGAQAVELENLKANNKLEGEVEASLITLVQSELTKMGLGVADPTDDDLQTATKRAMALLTAVNALDLGRKGTVPK